MFSITPLSFDAPSPGNPREYPHKPYTSCQNLESLDYVAVADSMGLSSFKFLWWALKDACVLKQSGNGRSRSSKVADFGNNRNRVCDFLLVIDSKLSAILPRLRDIAGFLLKRATSTAVPSEF